MSKLISATAAAVLNQRTGISPVVVVSVLWGYDLHWYATKDVEIPGLKIEPRILDIGSFNCQKKLDNSGSSGTIDFTLSDFDDSLKFLLDFTPIEKAPCAAFIYLEGTTLRDMILMMSGRLSNPNYREDNKSLSLTIETHTEENEAGFSPTLEDFPDLSEEANGTPWPMIFGHSDHVPALRARVKTKGFLLTDSALSSRGYIMTAADVIKPDTDVKGYSFFPDETWKEGSLFIQGGEKFPQGKEILISVDKVIFKGIFTGETFKITKANVPQHSGVELETVSDSELGIALPGTDKDIDKALSDFYDGTGESTQEIKRKYATCKIKDPKISIAGMYCYFGKQFNYCERQVGQIAIFKSFFFNPQTHKYMEMRPPHKIDAVYAIASNGVESQTVEESSYNLGTSAAKYSTVQQAAQNSFWKRQAQTPVYLWDAQDPDIYIASANELQSITAVYGKRTIKIPDQNQRKMFAPIPKEYYDISLRSNFQIHDQYVSGIILKTPLSEQAGDWEDEIYITGTSKVGPNPVDIIQWIVETFTTLTVDRGSFSDVRTKVTDSNFSYFDRRNALELAQEIAWQARCVLIVDSGIVKIYFVAEAPNTVFSFNDSNIEAGSIQIGYTSVDSIITRFVGTYTETYKDSPKPGGMSNHAIRELARELRALLKDTYKEQTATKTYTYRENIDRYGLLPESKNVFIYTKEADVKKCIDFWGHRAANSWQTVTFNTFLPAMTLQMYDGVTFSTTTNPIINSIGIVESIEYNHTSKDVTVRLWLPIKAGTNYQDEDAWQ